MKKSVLSVLGIVLLVTGVVINFSTNSEKKLQETITTYQDHESYDGKKYPLGLFTKEHYESEANFATELLNQLEKINIDDLNENDLISYKLLKFELNDILCFQISVHYAFLLDIFIKVNELCKHNFNYIFF